MKASSGGASEPRFMVRLTTVGGEGGTVTEELEMGVEGVKDVVWKMGQAMEKLGDGR